jgi:hypothetical protein
MLVSFDLMTLSNKTNSHANLSFEISIDGSEAYLELKQESHAWLDLTVNL